MKAKEHLLNHCLWEKTRNLRTLLWTSKPLQDIEGPVIKISKLILILKSPWLFVDYLRPALPKLLKYKTKNVRGEENASFLKNKSNLLNMSNILTEQFQEEHFR